MKKTEYNTLLMLLSEHRMEEFYDLFMELHERDQAEFINRYEPENYQLFAELFSPSEMSRLISYLDFNVLQKLINILPHAYLSEIFLLLPDDQLLDIVNDVEFTDRQKIIATLPSKTLEELNALLNNKVESAGSIMTSRFVSIFTNNTVDEVIKKIRLIGKNHELIYYIYCVDQSNHLMGVISLKELITEPGTKIIEDIMKISPISVNLDSDQENVAHLISDYNLLALPVVDNDNKIKGIVTVDDVIDIIAAETTEDFHKFSGILTIEEDDGDTITSMTKQRLPWLVLLIFLGLLSANLINYFEDTLSKVVALATFMPILLDSAGNAGTQSLAVAVRKLTLNEDSKEEILKVVFKEWVTGILVGLICGVTISIISYFMYHDIQLGLIVGASLAVTLSISTIIGYIIPTIFHKINIDPAVASGPFITTICDVFALIVYFGLASYFI